MFSFNNNNTEPIPIIPPVGGGGGGGGGAFGDSPNGGTHHLPPDDEHEGSSMLSDVDLQLVRKRSPSSTPITISEINTLFSEQAPLPQHRLFGLGEPMVHQVGSPFPRGSTSVVGGGASPPSNSGDLASSVQSVGGGNGNGGGGISHNPSMHSAVSETYQSRGSMQRIGDGDGASNALLPTSCCPQDAAIQTAIQINKQQRSSPSTTTGIHSSLVTSNNNNNMDPHHTTPSPLGPSNQLYHHIQRRANSSVFHTDPAPAPLPFPSLSPQLYPAVDATVEEINRSVESLDRIPLWDSQKMPHSELTSTLQHLRSLRGNWREAMEKRLGVLWLHVSDRYSLYNAEMDATLKHRHALEMEAAFGLKSGIVGPVSAAGAGTITTTTTTTGNNNINNGGGDVQNITNNIPKVRPASVDPGVLSGAANPLEKKVILHLASLGIRWPGSSSHADFQALVPVSYFSPPTSSPFTSGNTTGNNNNNPVVPGEQQQSNDTNNNADRSSRMLLSASRRANDGPSNSNNSRRKSDNSTLLLDEALLMGRTNGSLGDSLGGGLSATTHSQSGAGTIGNISGNGNATDPPPTGYVRLSSGKLALIGDISSYSDMGESRAHDARNMHRINEAERRRKRAGGAAAVPQPAYNPRSAILREAMGLPPLESPSSQSSQAKRRYNQSSANSGGGGTGSSSVRTPGLFKNGNGGGGTNTTSTTVSTLNNNNSTEPLFQKLNLLAVKQIQERGLFERISQNHFAQLSAAKANDAGLLHAKMLAAEEVLENVCDVVDRKVAAALLLARTNGSPAPMPSSSGGISNFLQRQASNVNKNSSSPHHIHATHIKGSGNAILNQHRVATNNNSGGGGGITPPSKPLGGGPAGKGGGSGDAPLTNNNIKRNNSNNHTPPTSSGGAHQPPLGMIINSPPKTAPGGSRPVSLRDQQQSLNDTARPVGGNMLNM